MAGQGIHKDSANVRRVAYSLDSTRSITVYEAADELDRLQSANDTLLAACKAVLANETCAGAFRAAMNMDEKFADDCPDYRLDCERDRDLFNQLTAAIAKAEGE